MFWNIFYWIFGIATCAYYAVETVAELHSYPFLCSFFVPLLIIPISNFIVFCNLGGRFGSAEDLRWIAPMQALAVAVSFILVVILSPLVLCAAIGSCLFFAFGFVSLIAFLLMWVAVGPFITSMVLYRRIKRSLAPGAKMPGWDRPTALAIVLSLLLLGLFPVTLTHACQAAAQNPAKREHSLLLLRAVGDDDALLKSCYDEFTNLPWYFQMFGEVFSNHGIDYAEDYSDGVNTYVGASTYQRARELFYRVRGKSFNSVSRPNTGEEKDFYYDSEYGWFNWYWGLRANDRDFGGDTVGGIVKGLSLDQSKITCAVDANEAVARMKWKMHFHNNDARHTELRGQILLPPHATITACTLWINGIRNDATFTLRDAGRQAYEASTLKGERPLLVSTAGAGRVLLQSAMGTWGKNAQLDVEITSPLTLVDKNKAALPLPVFSERNFAIGCDHDLEIQSQTSIVPKISISGLGNQTQSGSDHILRGKLTNSQITSALGTISFMRDPAITCVQSTDALAGKFGTVSKTQQPMLQETFISERLPSSSPLAVVIDGSASMNGIDVICQQLDKAHFADASLVWASDTPALLASHVSTSSPAWHNAVEALRDSGCVGGQDNGAALAKALQCTTKFLPVNVVWLHAPQPVPFAGTDLMAEIEKSHGGVKLYEYQIEPGPNVVIKSLDQSSALEQVPRIDGLSADLQSLLARLAGDKDNLRIVRDIAAKNVLAHVSHNPSELAQLQILDSLTANLSQNDRAAFSKLAINYHLVTPLTSALVLETEKTLNQYPDEKVSSGKNDTLTDSAKKAFPMVGFGEIASKPEPPISLLMLVALLISAPVLWKVRRKKAIA